MISDLKSFENGRSMQFDLCIVGAGPAGISIAREFSGSGVKLCLVESGGYAEEPETHALFRGESIGHPMALDEGRHRAFGGSSIWWGGRSAMLDPIDFKPRSWVRRSGWPFSLESLQPYYERAKRVGNFQEPWASLQQVEAALGISLPTLTTDDIDFFIWRVASPDIKRTLKTWLSLGYDKNFNWAEAYQGTLNADPNILVLLHANLTQLDEADDGRRVASIKVRSLSGVSMTIKADRFVLAGGGIENTRILLGAPRRMLDRINRFDTLGRYFAQHPRGCIARIEADRGGARKLQKLFNNFIRPRRARIQYETGFALSEQAQRRYQVLNASAAMYYVMGPNSSWIAGRRLRDALRRGDFASREVLRDTGHLLHGFGEVVPNAVRKYITGTEQIHAAPDIQVVVDLEQEPDPDSRITLSPERDRLGMQRAKIDWRIGALEKKTARVIANALVHEFRNLGFGRIEMADWLTNDAPATPEDLRGNYHFIGATRMSGTPQDGVVNADCRVHGVENLYVAGTSVFPTGGHANPTLTIVALAIRLADHLRDRTSARQSDRVMDKAVAEALL
jgi:choline dehydrogenase-like flavoprotein